MKRSFRGGLYLLILILVFHSFSLASEIVIIDVDDIIGPVTHRYIKRAIDKTIDLGSDLMIIRLNTPGGLVHSMEKILIDMINTPVIIVVYVHPMGGGANSAGVFLVAGADIAAMSPQTNIGSAQPVASDGAEIDETMQAKITNALIAKIKGMAEEKDRNVEWYEEAVTKSVNITAIEALELKVIDILAQDTDHLLEQLDEMVIVKNNEERHISTHNRNPIVLEMTFSETFLSYLQDPNLFMIFLSLGMLGLFIEITNPGLIFPGVLGSIFLVLGFFASQVLPISVAGLILITLSFLFLTIEALRPEFGIFGMGGIIAFILGGIMLFDTAETGLYVSRSLIFGIAFGLFLVMVIILGSVFRIFKKPDYFSFDKHIGKRTKIRRVDEKNDIYIYFDGSYWLADVDEEVKEGDLVEIIGKKDRNIIVKKV